MVKRPAYSSDPSAGRVRQLAASCASARSGIEIRMRLFRTLCLCVALSVGVYGPGCGDDETAEPGLDPSIADVVFDTGTTDEALLALVGATPKTDAAKAAALTSPADAAEVPGASPAELSWDVG